MVMMMIGAQVGIKVAYESFEELGRKREGEERERRRRRRRGNDKKTRFRENLVLAT